MQGERPGGLNLSSPDQVMRTLDDRKEIADECSMLRFGGAYPDGSNRSFVRVELLLNRADRFQPGTIMTHLGVSAIGGTPGGMKRRSSS